MRRKLPEYFHLQPIGQRIIKTAVAVGVKGTVLLTTHTP